MLLLTSGGVPEKSENGYLSRRTWGGRANQIFESLSLRVELHSGHLSSF